MLFITDEKVLRSLINKTKETIVPYIKKEAIRVFQKDFPGVVMNETQKQNLLATIEKHVLDELLKYFADGFSNKMSKKKI